MRYPLPTEQEAPRTTKPAPTKRYTPDAIRALGYEPIPVASGTHRIVPHWHPEHDIDVLLGLQQDGAHLYKLDIDSHTPQQNAEAQLTRIKDRIGLALYSRLAIRHSKRNGLHIIFKTTRPITDRASTKVYDPTHPTLHIGELIGPGLRATLTGQWLQHGPESIPVLSAIELDTLCAALHTPELYRDDEPADPNGKCRPRRKTRMAEGLSLIAGYDQVSNPQALLDTLCAKYIPVRQNLRDHRANPKDRSTSYSALVQSLMLHAKDLGTTTAERCRTVAAIALHVGAAGKEQNRDYNPLTDTAVLIARILHGDYYENSLEKGFLVPNWYLHASKTDSRPRHELPPPAPPPRPAGRPTGDREQNIRRVLRLVQKTPPDGYNRIFIEVDDLAQRCKVARRTMQSYLAELRTRGDIKTGQDGGNGALFVILKCFFGGADNPFKSAPTAAETPENRGADAPPEYRTPTPEIDTNSVQYTEVLRAPKESAPLPVPEPVLLPGDLALPPVAGVMPVLTIPALVREAFDAYPGRASFAKVLDYVIRNGNSGWRKDAIKQFYTAELKRRKYENWDAERAKVRAMSDADVLAAVGARQRTLVRNVKKPREKYHRWRLEIAEAERCKRGLVFPERPEPKKRQRRVTPTPAAARQRLVFGQTPPLHASRLHRQHDTATIPEAAQTVLDASPVVATNEQVDRDGLIARLKVSQQARADVGVPAMGATVSEVAPPPVSAPNVLELRVQPRVRSARPVILIGYQGTRVDQVSTTASVCAPALNPDDPWVRMQLEGLAAAERVGDTAKVQWYRYVLALN